jgi:hypothetical protein
MFVLEQTQNESLCVFAGIPNVFDDEILKALAAEIFPAFLDRRPWY